ncbi:MAG: glycine--tRNA ligase, partial [Dehalococcoidia bacterium]
CPECGGELTEPRMFNLMFRTYVGPVEDDASVAYLRPETAQGIFVNFANVLTTTRKKLPFGIAQIGKAFRNEITPGNFIFRDREFEQMEIEYFVKPGTDEEWHQHWVEERYNWYLRLGMQKDKLRVRRLDREELAHYAKDTYEVEYLFPMGWSELEGIANRTDFDLRRHAEFSGRELEYFDEETGEHIVPYVIEPSAGVDRLLMAFLIDAYDEEEVRGETRVILRLHKALAPIKVAVLPLSRHEKLVPPAREVWALVRKHWMSQYDDAQSIGRRYRRQDEVGTPLCVTIDFDTLEDEAVTIRERDSMEQVRVPIAGLVAALRERLEE